MMSDLEEWRRRIDEIDEQIVKLLGERTRYALLIGQRKRAQGLPLRSVERELEVLARVVQLGNFGPLSTEALLAIYRIILDETRKLQEKASQQDSLRDAS
jgi:chorismate mutase